MKKIKLFLLAFLVVGAWVNTYADVEWTDKTATYVVNPGFESCTVTTTNAAASGSAAPLDISGNWTQSSSAAWSSSAVVAYGGDGKVNGVSAPSADNASNSGNALGVSVGWSGIVTYQSSSSVTLPAGRYKMTVHAYNNLSGKTQFKSLNGFVPTSGSSYLSSKTSFTYASWETDVISFDLTQATEGKFQIGGQAVSGGSGENAKVFFDNITLEYIAWTEYSSTNTYDMTSWIVNPSFELNTFTGTQADGSSIGDSGGTINKPTGYTCYFNIEGWRDCNSNTTAPADGTYCMNSWFGTIREQKFYQTIDYLPEGVYEISAQVRTDQTSTEGIYTYGIAGGNTFKSASWDASKMAGTWNSMENWQTLTARASVIGGGSLQFGLRSDKFVQFDDFHLTYLGSDLLLSELKSSFSTKQTTATSLLSNSTYDNVVGTERATLTAKKGVTPAETVESWTTAVNELQDAIDAFTAAKANYDALVAEIAKAKALGIASVTADGYAATSSSTAATALTNTQNLKVAEYTFITEHYTESATLGAWTEDFAEDLDGEGYVAGGEKYWNEWGTATRTGKQTVTLPAGDYAVSCIARGAVGTSGYLYYKIGSGDAVTTSFNMKGNRGKGVDTSGAANFGDGTYTCDNNGFGWEYNFLTITLADEAEVEIGVSTTFAGNWVSVYKPQVLTTEATVKALRLSEISDALASVPSGKMNADVQSTLDDKADAAGDASDSNTKDELTTILDDLKDAIDDANTSIAAYASVKAAIDYAKGVSLTGSSLDISTYEDAYNDASMLDSDAETIVTAIKEALTTALISQTLVADVTALLTNPSFENETTGWSAQFSSTAARSWGNETNAEATEGAKVLTMHTDNGHFTGFAVDQPVKLPAGYYRMTADVKSTNVEVNTYIFASTNTTWSGKDMATLSTAKVMTADTWESLETIFYVNEEKTVYLGVTTEGPNWNGGTYANYKADNFKLYYLGDKSATMAIADANKYATFVAPFDVTIPSGVTAYKILTKTDNTLNLTAVETTIPANTPVVVYSESDVNETFYNRNISGTPTVGLLTGVYTTTAAPNGSYILQNQDDKVGFYQVDTSVATPNVPANRAYLTVGGGVKAYFFGGETIIKNVFDGVAAGEIYDLNGTKVSKMQPGKAYIVNGATVIVK